MYWHKVLVNAVARLGTAGVGEELLTKEYWGVPVTGSPKVLIQKPNRRLGKV